MIDLAQAQKQDFWADGLRLHHPQGLRELDLRRSQWQGAVRIASLAQGLPALQGGEASGGVDGQHDRADDDWLHL